MKRAVVAVVQARMGASRLPNKMMLWLHGLPVIEWIYRRVSQSRCIDKVVFALPETLADNVLADYLTRLGATVFRGSEEDVLGRMVAAARAYGAGTVVRVCADNPFVSGSEIDRLIDFFATDAYDYAYNHIPSNNRYPDGLGAEIASMQVMEMLQREAVGTAQREHVFNHLWDNPGKFSVGTCDPLEEALAHPELKLDLDTADDYAALLRLNVQPDMTALEIVAAVLNARQETI